MKYYIIILLNLSVFNSARNSVAADAAICPDQSVMRTKVNTLRTQDTGLSAVSVPPNDDGVNNKLIALVGKLSGKDCKPSVNGLEYSDLSDSSLNMGSVAYSCIEDAKATEEEAITFAFESWVKNGLTDYKYPGENVKIEDGCTKNIQKNNFLLMISKETKTVQCACNTVDQNKKQIFVGCYFGNVDFEASGIGAKTTSDVFFNYKQFTYIQVIIKTTYKSFAVSFETCVSDFTSEMLEVINKLRNSTATSAQAKAGTSQTSEALLLQFDVGHDKPGKNNFNVRLPNVYKIDIVDPSKQSSDDVIANSTVEKWIEGSVEKYRYTGAKANVSDECGETTNDAASLKRNAFVLMVAKSTQSISCSKMESGGFLLVSCAFELDPDITDDCKTEDCIFGDNTFNSLCDVSLCFNLLFPGYNATKKLRVCPDPEIGVETCPLPTSENTDYSAGVAPPAPSYAFDTAPEIPPKFDEPNVNVRCLNVNKIFFLVAAALYWRLI